MSAAQPDPLSRIDALADRFESAWKAGSRPRIEEFVADVAEPVRTTLLRELLPIDLFYRQRLQETPAEQEYETRFPEHGTVVREVFQNARRGSPPKEEVDTQVFPFPDPGRPSRNEAAEAGLQAGAEPILSPGTVLGEYQIQGLLGKGGMAQVYKAWQSRLQRWVAVKVFSPGLHLGPGAADRFRRESLATARLAHPNLVATYDAGEQEGILYFVMELLGGSNLQELVQREGPLPPERAVEVILQAARGLAYAHEQGIIHRDVKPANLVLEANGAIKVLDLGLARFREALVGEFPWGSLT